MSELEDGGMGRPGPKGEQGRPLWSFTSFGDTGNGFLSAIGIVNAIYHRNRTGEGQFVDTSIINAALLNTSYAVGTPQGKGFERPQVDGEQFGFNAGHRLYKTKQGWLCLMCVNQSHWDELLTVLRAPKLVSDERFATDAARKKHDKELIGLIEERML